MARRDTHDQPFWTKGNLAPVHEEITAFDLPVEGSIPTELRGLYARNGANPREGHAGHWFFGDGMIHGVSLVDGKAEWYRNRWVRTRAFTGEQKTLDPFSLRASVANTNVMAHAGRIMALVENALPMEMSRELDTIGYHDYGGALKTPFTAHPKICPASGEMHFFGYGFRPPYLTYHMADSGGVLQRSLEIPVRKATMMHDFALTAGHVIFMDLPVVFDMMLAMRGTMPFTWSDKYGARLGILPRGAGIAALRWVEIEPCYVFHVGNAFEETDGTIVIDVAAYDELWRGGPSATRFESASLRRWRVPPGATKAAEETMDERAVEFPRIDDRRAGSRHAFVYAVGATGALDQGGEGQLIKVEAASGRSRVRDLGAGVPSEFVFVGAADSGGEDEGWLMGFVYDRTREASDLMILDAQRMDARPVARIELPCRVPQGFHGNWLPDAVD